MAQTCPASRRFPTLGGAVASSHHLTRDYLVTYSPIDDRTNGADTLNYNLYTTNAYSVVWGDGTGSTVTVAGSMRLTSPNPTKTNTHTVYGRIPALQDAAVGSDYQDNVTVTVTY